MSQTALFIEHDALAPPAMLGEAFTELGYDVDMLVIDGFTADTVVFPDPADYQALILLGARVSVYDPVLIDAWIADEMDFLRDADSQGIPVLGVCFGGQLLAQTHGGSVTRSKRPEVGWYEIDSQQTDLVPPGPWYQWHTDAWTVPPDAIEIASNANASQAFRLRNNLAVQFHPELDTALLEKWLEVASNPGADGKPIDTRALLERTRLEEPDAASRVRQLVAGFVRSTASPMTHAAP